MLLKDLNSGAFLLPIHQQQILGDLASPMSLFEQNKETLALVGMLEVLNIGTFEDKPYFIVDLTFFDLKEKSAAPLISLNQLQQRLPTEYFTFIERAMSLHQWRFGEQRCGCCMSDSN